MKNIKFVFPVSYKRSFHTFSNLRHVIKCGSGDYLVDYLQKKRAFVEIYVV